MFDDDLFAGMRDAANSDDNSVGAGNSVLDGGEGQNAAEKEAMTEDAVIDPDDDNVPQQAEATPDVGSTRMVPIQFPTVRRDAASVEHVGAAVVIMVHSRIFRVVRRNVGDPDRFL